MGYNIADWFSDLFQVSSLVGREGNYWSADFNECDLVR